MRGLGNAFQVKEQDKTTGKKKKQKPNPNETEVGNLPDKKFTNHKNAP